jgi:hypothetical protein
LHNWIVYGREGQELWAALVRRLGSFDTIQEGEKIHSIHTEDNAIYTIEHHLS